MALSAQAWEQMWAPYDEPMYTAVLDAIRSDDVVLDIGAGDLRLTRRLAQRARRVYALEMNAALLPPAMTLPPNLHSVCADARSYPFPTDVTLAVLLMRHCQHVAVYAEKLRAVGCRYLITNARWGFGVECIDLLAARRPFTAVPIGWYACSCGATGFVPGPPEKLTLAVETAVYEVTGCPRCDRQSVNCKS